MQKTRLERLAEKYAINATTGCWDWTASAMPAGYGYFHFPEAGENRAHRAAYILLVGEIPNSLWVLHRCDNPRCVNPDHLFLGTCSDNTVDKFKKGRGPNVKGEKNGHAKLTEQAIRFIDHSALPQSAMARMFGVNQSQISRAKNRRRWAHLP